MVSNPLYNDVAFSEAHSNDKDSPNTHAQVSVYAYATNPECQAKSVQSNSSEVAKQTVAIDPQLVRNHVTFQEPTQKSLTEAPDSLDYSTLDPTTSYASLEPYTGNPPPPVPKHKNKPQSNSKADGVTDTDPGDYSHLSH